MWVLSQRYSRPWPLPCPQSLSGGQSAGPRRSRLQLRIVWLMFVLTLNLPGCATLAAPTNDQTGRITVITKPVLNSLSFDADGGMCMDKHDSEDLLIYIRTLERELGLRSD